MDTAQAATPAVDDQAQAAAGSIDVVYQLALDRLDAGLKSYQASTSGTRRSPENSITGTTSNELGSATSRFTRVP